MCFGLVVLGVVCGLVMEQRCPGSPAAAQISDESGQVVMSLDGVPPMCMEEEGELMMVTDMAEELM